MTIELNKNEEAIFKAMLQNVVDSNIGTESLYGWECTKYLSPDEIEESFQILYNRIIKS